MSFLGDLMPAGSPFSKMFGADGPLGGNSILGRAFGAKPGAIDQPPQKPPNPDAPGRTSMLGGGSAATY